LRMDGRQQEMEQETMRVDVEDLVQGYGNRTILDGVSLSVDEGEVMTVLGPNGSGKSTLIKTICRIMEPRSGRITLDGKDASSIPKEEFARLVGYVPQNPEFIGYTNVYDAVLVGRRPYVKWNYSREDIRMAAESMRLMRLEEFFDRQVTEMSGGQRQRVTLARALTQDPRLYVFDEPTSALDLRHQLDTLRLMRSVIRDRGSSMIIALHDLNLAIRYSDKVMVLKDGKVYGFGSSEEVITERMIRDVYGVESEIVEGKNGRYIHAYDGSDDDYLV
ncbi:MAG: ABC transporter ATP-binding protein, partial [Candidatus Methanomethylophilaceae archaeon]